LEREVFKRFSSDASQRFQVIDALGYFHKYMKAVMERPRFDIVEVPRVIIAVISEMMRG
jgi:hypothetical protein